MQETRRQVLEALADGPVSGPEVADRLDVSRAAVWKHVEALREAGFEITDDDGYRLVDVPAYGGPAVEFGLDAPFEVEFHDAIDSTNDRARDLAVEGAADVAVLAERQTGGRGRLDREWASPPGGVYVSLVLRPDLAPSQVPVLTLAAAVATARAAEATGVEVGIKWPNDVVVPSGDTARGTESDGVRAGDREEKKLAGVLTEMEGEADRVSWVVLGIGVNANVDADALPDRATSLRAAVGDVDRREFVQTLLEAFDALRGDPDAVLPAWRELSTTLGRRVRVETPADEVVGEAVDVEFPGTLVVEADEGTRRVSAGDCEHLRPA